MKKTLLAAVLGLATLAPLAPVVHAETYSEERRERFTARVDTVFKSDPYLSRFRSLNADSKGNASGYIQLEGRVATAYLRQRAFNLAKRAAPGYRIVNKIRVGRSRY